MSDVMSRRGGRVRKARARYEMSYVMSYVMFTVSQMSGRVRGERGRAWAAPPQEAAVRTSRAAVLRQHAGTALTRTLFRVICQEAVPSQSQRPEFSARAELVFSTYMR